MKKRILVLTCVVTLMLALVPATTFAATEGGATGTFSNNNSPSITYVKLYDTGGTPGETAAMTPQIEYDARVKVTDGDGKADLTTIVVKIYYDADGSTSGTEFDGKAADTQNCAIITWTQSSGIFSIEPSASTTWSLGGTSVEPANLDGEFQFKFTVGKVATETTGSAKWQIAARVTDDSAQTVWAADADSATMAWYGEITVPAATVSWGTVNPGMNFAAGTPSEQPLGATITYISNGAYDEKVKSSATWSTVATLDVTGVCDDPNEFALKADDSGTFTSAVLVDTTGAAIDESGTQTPETGDNAANNTLWLKLASTFDKGTYSGTITYIIADGT
jgi:hypothetical protein